MGHIGGIVIVVANWDYLSTSILPVIQTQARAIRTSAAWRSIPTEQTVILKNAGWPFIPMGTGVTVPRRPIPTMRAAIRMQFIPIQTAVTVGLVAQRCIPIRIHAIVNVPNLSIPIT